MKSPAWKGALLMGAVLYRCNVLSQGWWIPSKPDGLLIIEYIH